MGDGWELAGRRSRLAALTAQSDAEQAAREREMQAAAERLADTRDQAHPRR
jgi:hypothetical protein